MDFRPRPQSGGSMQLIRRVPVNGETFPADTIRRLLEKLTSSDFYGECKIQINGGHIYRVEMTQSFTAETIHKLIS